MTAIHKRMDKIDDSKPRDNDLRDVERLQHAFDNVVAEVGKVIVGQQPIIEQMMIAMLSEGHALLVGVPGLAKTLMVRTLCRALDLKFRRIQFTPDLMPSDITGIEVMHEDKSTGDRQLQFHPGPIFANIVLADEINRTPPKTQAALLEAMQEHQVTVGGQRHDMADPFFVLATQNPVEQEGTYRLPEALLDRFMFQILIDYPPEDEELEIVKRTTAESAGEIQAVMTGQEISELSQLVRRVPIADHIASYALKIARLSRPGKRNGTDNSRRGNSDKRSQAFFEYIDANVNLGAGPRASQYLVLAAKARAVLRGQHHVSHDDVDAVATPTLRHRIRTNFTASSEGIDSDHVVTTIIEYLHQTQSRDERGPIAKILKPARSRHD